MGLKEVLSDHWQIAKDLRFLEIDFDPVRCAGTWQCYEVCPMGRWEPDHAARIPRLRDAIPCIACGACVLQCPEGAIRLIRRG